eukprot:3414307-Ditylum_brightwellii.AAC.1
MTSDDIPEGNHLPMLLCDLGSCELYPQMLKHNCNGLCVVGASDDDFLSLPNQPNPGQNENPASSLTTNAATNIVAIWKCGGRRQ